jgi:hypothetical protein
MPKLGLVAFLAAVLLPKLIGTLSYPVLYVARMLFHLGVPVPII